MIVNSPEPTPLSHWLRRLWPMYCFLAILSNFGYALYDSYQIDGDAVSYMDIGDLMRAHNWPGIINGYWNPLLSGFSRVFGHAVFHPTRYTERCTAYYMVNFWGTFILEMLAQGRFTDALRKLLDLRESVSTWHRPARTFFSLTLYAPLSCIAILRDLDPARGQRG